MEPHLTIDSQEHSGDVNYTVVSFSGEFDKAGHNEIQDDLSAIVKEFSGKYLIFDFTNLRFINSEGIGYLMEVHTHLAQRDRKLVIVGVNSHIADVFKTIGIAEVVALRPSLSDFLNEI